MILCNVKSTDELICIISYHLTAKEAMELRLKEKGIEFILKFQKISGINLKLTTSSRKG